MSLYSCTPSGEVERLATAITHQGVRQLASRGAHFFTDFNETPFLTAATNEAAVILGVKQETTNNDGTLRTAAMLTTHELIKACGKSRHKTWKSEMR